MADAATRSRNRSRESRCCELCCTMSYGFILVYFGGTSLLAAYAAAFDTGEKGVLPRIYPPGPRLVAELVQNDGITFTNQASGLGGSPAKPGLFDDVRRANYEPVARACSFAAANTSRMAYGYVDTALSERRPLAEAMSAIGHNIRCHALTTDPALLQGYDGAFVAPCPAIDEAPPTPPAPFTTQLYTLRLIGNNRTEYDCTSSPNGKRQSTWQQRQMELSQYERSLLLMAPLIRALASPEANSDCGKLKSYLQTVVAKLDKTRSAKMESNVETALNFLYKRVTEAQPLTSAEWPFVPVSDNGYWNTELWSGPQRTAGGNSTFEPRITTTAMLIDSLLSMPKFYEEIAYLMTVDMETIGACLIYSPPGYSSSCESAEGVVAEEDVCTSVYGPPPQQPQQPNAYTAVDYFEENYPVTRVVLTERLGGGLFTSLLSEGQQQPPVRVAQPVCRRDALPEFNFAYPPPPAPQASAAAYDMATKAAVMQNMRTVCEAVHTWGIYDRDHTFGIPDPTSPRKILYPDEVVDLKDENNAQFAWPYKGSIIYSIIESNPYESWYEPLIAGQALTDLRCDRAKRSLAYVWYIWGITITAATPAVVTAGFMILYGFGMLLASVISIFIWLAGECFSNLRCKEDTIPYLPEQNFILLIMAIGVLATWQFCSVAESILSGEHTRYSRPRCSFDGGLWLASEKYADVFITDITGPLWVCLATGLVVRLFRYFMNRLGARMVPASKKTRQWPSIVLLLATVVWQAGTVINRSNVLIQSTQRVARARLASPKMCESPHSQHAGPATFCNGLRGGGQDSTDFDKLVEYAHGLFSLAWYTGATCGVMSSSWAFFIPQAETATATAATTNGLWANQYFQQLTTVFFRADRLAYVALVIFTISAYLYAAISLTRPFACDATDAGCIAERDEQGLLKIAWLTWPGVLLLSAALIVKWLLPFLQRLRPPRAPAPAAPAERPPASRRSSTTPSRRSSKRERIKSFQSDAEGTVEGVLSEARAYDADRLSRLPLLP